MEPMGSYKSGSDGHSARHKAQRCFITGARFQAQYMQPYRSARLVLGGIVSCHHVAKPSLDPHLKRIIRSSLLHLFQHIF